MTVGGWILFVFLSLCIIGVSIAIGLEVEGKGSLIFIVVVTFILIIALFAGMQFYYKGTESGQRAFKTQQSNFNGGLNRTVTVYSYSGDEIRSWTGRFDVTENDQETWFDIDGRRVIIQGGIIINEEEPTK